MARRADGNVVIASHHCGVTGYDDGDFQSVVRGRRAGSLMARALSFDPWASRFRLMNAGLATVAAFMAILLALAVARAERRSLR